MTIRELVDLINSVTEGEREEERRRRQRQLSTDSEESVGKWAISSGRYQADIRPIPGQ